MLMARILCTVSTSECSGRAVAYSRRAMLLMILGMTEYSMLQGALCALSLAE